MRFYCRLLLLAVASPLFGQAPAFDAASVKPSPPLNMARYGDFAFMPRVKIDPAHATFRNQSLRALITLAWSVKDYQVSGPEWLQNARFDIEATLPEGSATSQVPEMLQALLAERFQLKLHKAASNSLPGQPTGKHRVTKDFSRTLSSRWHSLFPLRPAARS